MTALTWRGHAALLQTWYEVGESFWLKAKNLVVAGAALKILFGWSVLTMLALSPLMAAAYVLSGVLWMRYGWIRQQSEVAALERLNPIVWFQLQSQARMMAHFGLPLNGQDEAVRHALRNVLLVTKR